LAGETNVSLGFASIQSSNAGCYSVVISNLLGVITNRCCVVVDPPQLRSQFSATNLVTISAALRPGCVLQRATNLSPSATWESVLTNTTTNCFFFFAAPLMNTN